MKKLYCQRDETSGTVDWVSEKNDATKVTTDAQGAASFKGLNIGHYYLEEVKAPDGYNTLEKPVGVDVLAYSANGQIDTNAELNGNRYQVTSTITNNKGTVLPSTGGIGTTNFYVVGGLLMVGAAILLITKKRMHNNG